MKQTNSSQELLLITSSSLKNHCFCSKEDKTYNNKSSEEKLEQACWDGLLPFLLPSSILCSAAGQKQFVWEVVAGEHFIRVNIGPHPFNTRNSYSIDPYSFILTVPAN